MCPEFIEAVCKIMTHARQSSRSGTLILHFEALAQELIEDHDITREEADELLFEATMAGDLVMNWRDGHTYPFVLLPKEGISQDA
jgi:hypothetical protein